MIETFVASRFFRPTIAAGLVIFIGVLILITAKCGRIDHTAERQAEQTTRSGEAITAAATDAIQIIGDRAASDRTVDDAVTTAMKGIDDAKSVDDIRRAVVSSLCQQAAHSGDPACRVRQADR